MSQEAPGRLFQDTDFIVDGFKGKKLEGLIGVVDREEPDSGPLLIYIKAEDNAWQQFFLEEGMGIWENWGELDIDDPSFLYIDYAKEFNLGYEAIHSVYCLDSCITIEFKNKETLLLRYVDAENKESDCEFVKEV